ncbi:MAG: OsmC family protein [Desulfobacterales bacterium]
MAVEAQLEWTREMQFIGRAGQGPGVILDSPEGGSGTSPMALMLIGVAGCSGMDVVSILKKKRSTFSGLTVRIRGERQDAYPKRYSAVQIEFVVRGDGVKPGDVEKAIELSMNKYCGAIASLNAEVTHSYRILAAEAEA